MLSATKEPFHCIRLAKPLTVECVTVTYVQLRKVLAGFSGSVKRRTQLPELRRRIGDEAASGDGYPIVAAPSQPAGIIAQPGMTGRVDALLRSVGLLFPSPLTEAYAAKSS